MPAVSSLYAITQRLVLTPPAELPHLTGFLASSIYSCAAVLSRPPGTANAKGNDDYSVLVHKLKTRLSSLLQDQDPRARWTAVILIKATVEAGDWEILNRCASWLRGIISILGRPNSPALSRSCLITVTRILILVHQYPTLVREIANPILPSFISACISLASADSTSKELAWGSNSISTTILQTFSSLIPKYPSIFRPFRAKIWFICTQCLGAVAITHPAHKAACNTLVQIHQCASKSHIEAEWERLSKSVIFALHVTIDHLFRSIKEDWEPSNPETRRTPAAEDFGEDVSGDYEEPLKLPGWTGVSQGTDRLESLVSLLRSLLDVTTSTSMPFPLGAIIDVTSRMTSLTVPSSTKPLQMQLRIRDEATRLEREELFAALPRIHVCSLQLLTNLMDTFKCGLISLTQNLIEQMLFVFDAEKEFPDIRTVCYDLLSESLPFVARSWSKSNIIQIQKLIQQCCRDTLSNNHLETSSDFNELKSSAHHSLNGRNLINADGFLTKPDLKPSSQRVNQSKVEYAATHLLPQILTFVPSSAMSLSLRAELDRTAIFSRHKDAMLASVLNPIPSSYGKTAVSSVMPFFARECGHDLQAEGILRPRMPAFPNLQNGDNDLADSEYDNFSRLRQDGQSQLWSEERPGHIFGTGADPQERHEGSENDATEKSTVDEAKNGFLTVSSDSPIPDHSTDASPNQAPKRDWESANSPAKIDDVIPKLATTLQASKRPRFSEEGNPFPPLDAQSVLTPSTQQPLSGRNSLSIPITDDRNLSPAKKDDQIPDTSQDVQEARKYDSNGDSDFEIPAIDTTLDTDDEDQGDSDQS